MNIHPFYVILIGVGVMALIFLIISVAEDWKRK